jgi:hypothetical protein
LSRYRHAEAKGERRYSSYSFFTSALDGGEWSASRPCRTYPSPPARILGTQWIKGWVGLRAGLDTEVRVKVLWFWRRSNPGRPVCGQILHWLSYCSYSSLSEHDKNIIRADLSPTNADQTQCCQRKFKQVCYCAVRLSYSIAPPMNSHDCTQKAQRYGLLHYQCKFTLVVHLACRLLRDSAGVEPACRRLGVGVWDTLRHTAVVAMKRDSCAASCTASEILGLFRLKSPCSRVLSQKLAVAQLINKLFASYETWNKSSSLVTNIRPLLESEAALFTFSKRKRGISYLL